MNTLSITKMLLIWAAFVCLALAQTGSNQSEPETTVEPNRNSSEMTFSTETSTGLSNLFHMITSMSSESMETTTKTLMASNTSDSQPVQIGNSSPPTVLQVDTSSELTASPNQTNPSDSSSNVTSRTVTETSTTPFTTSATSSTTDSWVPGKFPPPGLTSGTNRPASPSSMGTHGVSWEVNGNTDMGKNKYDTEVALGDEPHRTDGDKMTGAHDAMGSSATMGYSREMGSESKAKKNDRGNGAISGLQTSFPLILSSVMTMILLFRH